MEFVFGLTVGAVVTFIALKGWVGSILNEKRKIKRKALTVTRKYNDLIKDDPNQKNLYLTALYDSIKNLEKELDSKNN